ncbi:hypothetical protein EJ08DRAFT_666444 [Tothia fuscella]|uniref:Uncharacterized protein n=1 Tax=Tothia fuscella TaxID=1048955 RepID=A0A9P4NEU7_9PEZI|nr:hypothetical protein EJ08DRAFT_666444 [Tothia fuscella]
MQRLFKLLDAATWKEIKTRGRSWFHVRPLLEYSQLQKYKLVSKALDINAKAYWEKRAAELSQGIHFDDSKVDESDDEFDLDNWEPHLSWDYYEKDDYNNSIHVRTPGEGPQALPKFLLTEPRSALQYRLRRLETKFGRLGIHPNRIEDASQDHANPYQHIS